MISRAGQQSRQAKAPRYSPPCQGGCPVHTPVQSYVNLVAQGRFRESLREIMAYNPFPSSCGRVCFHPCEDNCRRGDVDSSISIMAIKRFVTDTVRDSGEWVEKQDVDATNGKKVAVIGSGPAGMSAAYDLARMGCDVTVLEREKAAGGMLRRGILDFRLPQDILDHDIDYILSHGIDLKTGVELVANSEVNGDGSKVSIDSLTGAGYDAVLVTVGLSASRGLPIPNTDAKGVHLAVPFLRAVNEGELPDLGEDVLVVGGGNVAIDVARSAKRVSNGKVKMCCLEARDEMPAHEWEITDAVAEGIEMHCSRGPNEVKMDDTGNVTGLEIKEVACVFDAAGRFAPEFHADSEHVLECDTLILAIGQMSELDFCDGSGVERNERGQLIVDRNTWMTTRDGVFAGGEVAAGPGAAITAIAGGHTAATEIAKYLELDNPARFLPPEDQYLESLPAETADKVRKENRATAPQLGVDERIVDFSEIDLGFGSWDAVREAQRCMNCAAGATVVGEKCTSCLTCVRACPYDIPEISEEVRVAQMDPNKCQSCGICAAECPANAIEISMEIDRPGLPAFDKLEAGQDVVGFYCQYGRFANPEAGLNAKVEFEGVQMLPVLCTGRLEETDILRPIVEGAQTVFVCSCPDVSCHHNRGSWRAHKRIARAQQLLEDAGTDRDRVKSFVTYPSGSGYAPFIEELKNMTESKVGK